MEQPDVAVVAVVVPEAAAPPLQPVGITENSSNGDGNDRSSPSPSFLEAEPSPQASPAPATVSPTATREQLFDDDDAQFSDALSPVPEEARETVERWDYEPDDDPAAESLREQQAALASSLPPHRMTLLEYQHLPEFREHQQLYVDLRNIILTAWQSDVSDFLNVQDACASIQSRFLPAAHRVFGFLEQHGFINVGLLPSRAARPRLIGQRTQRKRVLVIGAGMSGLATARQLRALGHEVLVLEGRDRLGGRVCTDRTTFSGPVDLGASIITGLGGNPLTILCRQMVGSNVGRLMHFINNEGNDIYERDGRVAPKELDDHMQEVFNQVLSGTDYLRAPLLRQLAARMRAENNPEAEVLHHNSNSSSSSNGSNGSSSGDAADGSNSKPTTTSSFLDFMSDEEDDIITIRGDEDEDEDMDFDDDDEDGNAGASFRRNHPRLARALRRLMQERAADLPQMNLWQGAEAVLAAMDLGGDRLSDRERRLLDWHAANLEYGCAADLSNLSLPHWDQDDPFGFTGPHSLIRHGIAQFVERMGEHLDIRLQQEVLEIKYSDNNNDDDAAADAASADPQLPTAESPLEQKERKPAVASPSVRVTVRDHTAGGQERVFEADCVVCSASLGVLKSGSIQFSPSLPDWKQQAIETLGYGLLNKLILEFPEAFWERHPPQHSGLSAAASPAADMWGSATYSGSARGRFYIFWNLHRAVKRPLLVALAAGQAAHDFENEDPADSVRDALSILRSIFGEANVPDPVQHLCTRWWSDPFARGSYSFVAPGSSGETYDLLAAPVGQALHFAGEATNRMNPATVPGAMISGLRCAGRLDHAFTEWTPPDLSGFPKDAPGFRAGPGAAVDQGKASQFDEWTQWTQRASAHDLQRYRRGMRGGGREKLVDPEAAAREAAMRRQLEEQRQRRIKQLRDFMSGLTSQLLRGDVDPLSLLRQASPTNDAASGSGGGGGGAGYRLGSPLPVTEVDRHSFAVQRRPKKPEDEMELPSIGSFATAYRRDQQKRRPASSSSRSSTSAGSSSRSSSRRDREHRDRSDRGDRGDRAAREAEREARKRRHSEASSSSSSSTPASSSSSKRHKLSPSSSSSSSSSSISSSSSSRSSSSRGSEAAGGAAAAEAAAMQGAGRSPASGDIIKFLQKQLDKVSLKLNMKLDKETYKSVVRRAYHKVHPDWLSKPRRAEDIQTWLRHEPRKIKVQQLVGGYLKKLRAQDQQQLAAGAAAEPQAQLEPQVDSVSPSPPGSVLSSPLPGLGEQEQKEQMQ